jgi:hypothetical protein
MDSDDMDMANVMGFSSFSEMPKPKRQKRGNDSPASQTTNPNKTPLGNLKVQRIAQPVGHDLVLSANALHSSATSSIKLPLGQQAKTSTAAADDSAAAAIPVEREATALDPPRREEKPLLLKTLDELSPSDLQLFRKGVVRADGQKVYFSKGFIEDPWARLRGY